MTVLARSLHTTDEQLDTGSQQRDCRRTIRNWTNYQSPGGLWLPTAPTLGLSSAAPPDWTGTWDMMHAATEQPLQAFVVDSTEADNTALLGVRLASRPECWVNLKALGVQAGVAPIVDPVARSFTWPDLWHNCDLTWTVGAHKVEKLITLKAKGHPVRFSFSLRVADGCSCAVVDNCLVVYDPQGVEWLRTPAAWGEDANGTPIPVVMTLGGNVHIKKRDYLTVVVDSEASALAKAVYPVRVDPTATISGTASIDDTFLASAAPDGNYGALANVRVANGAAAQNLALLRVATASIPAASGYSAFRLFANFYIIQNPGVAIAAYRVADANAAWVEGAGTSGSAVAGAACWNYLAYNTTAWAGSAGLGTSGTDYYADASPPQITLAATGGYTFALNVAWVAAWKGGAPNGGILAAQLGAPVTGVQFVRSSEASTAPAYFEIDYAAAGPVAPVLSYLRQRSRK